MASRAPVNPNVPPTVASEVTERPVPEALLNVSVSAISAVLLASSAPVKVKEPPILLSAVTESPVPEGLLNVKVPATSPVPSTSMSPVIFAFPPTVKSPPIDAPAVTANPLTPVPFAFVRFNVSETLAPLLTESAPVTLVVPEIPKSPLMFVAPLNVVVPATSNVPAIVVLPVLSETINLSESLVIPPLTANAPPILAGPVTPRLPPTVKLFDIVAALVTDKVFPKAAAPTTDNAVPETLLNVKVSLISVAALISTELSDVIAPVTFNVFAISTSSENVASPDTFNVPPTIVFPVLSATLNLSVSTVIPPFADKAPDNTEAPDTFKEPEVVEPVMEAFPPIAASETTDKPFPEVLLKVKVSAISAVLFASRAPVNVVTPDTPKVVNAEVPETFKLPVVVILPVLSSTTNLLESIVIPPLTANAPATVIAPEISTIPATFKLLDRVVAP